VAAASRREGARRAAACAWNCFEIDRTGRAGGREGLLEALPALPARRNRLTGRDMSGPPALQEITTGASNLDRALHGQGRS
jgi:hypothetical protein